MQWLNCSDQNNFTTVKDFNAGDLRLNYSDLISLKDLTNW